ncbi:hypothetical protein SF1_01630 [Sphingobacterium faecium NBRC 15299]|nr:hypothetical protein SF1_01630 [Sphingobacterium faecium NBRC 15299]
MFPKYSFGKTKKSKDMPNKILGLKFLGKKNTAKIHGIKNEKLKCVKIQNTK